MTKLANSLVLLALLGSSGLAADGLSVSRHVSSPRNRAAAVHLSASPAPAATEEDRALVERSAKIMEKFLERDRRKRSRNGGGGTGKTTTPPKGKRFKFAATVSSSTTVRETAGAGAMGVLTLDEYMGLPLDQYILLDDRVVSRTADGFHFALPFGALEVSPGKKLFAGVLGGADALRAECDLAVDSNVVERRNTISGSNFKIVVEEQALEAAKAQAEADTERLEKIQKMMKPVAPQAPGARPDTPVAVEGESVGQTEVVQEAVTTAEEDGTTADRISITAHPSENSDTTTDEEEEKRKQLVLKRQAETMKQMKSIENKLGSLSSEERAELDATASRKIIRGLAGVAPEADGAVVLQWGKVSSDGGGRGMGRLANMFSGGGGDAGVAVLSPNGDVVMTRELTAKLTLNAELTLAVPFPRVLLNPLGSLVLKLAFGQVLPRVLRIVAMDYERRAAGKSDAGGEPTTELVDGGILGGGGGAMKDGSADDWRGL